MLKYICQPLKKKYKFEQFIAWGKKMNEQSMSQTEFRVGQALLRPADPQT